MWITKVRQEKFARSVSHDFVLYFCREEIICGPDANESDVFEA